MELTPLKIKNLPPVLPIIQGGMAVRVSTGKLAGAVARNNAIGVIGGSGMKSDELRKEIAIARKESKGKGIVAVNIMVAASEFFELVDVVIEEKADLLICGAGFSRDVFKVAQDAGMPFAPIVSSTKAAKLAYKLGADIIIVEGKEAGGHLGTDRPLKEILVEIISDFKGKVPIVGAGGILWGQDVCDILTLGADGVQMATRFVLSDECNVDIKFKEKYLNSSAKDMKLFDSPVGYPGRAIMTDFLRNVEEGKQGPFPCRYLCLKSCNRRFCIIEALQRAQEGDVENGIVFSGERFFELKEILPVDQIFKDLLAEVKQCKEA